MFIVIPHQRKPHVGHECSHGSRDCEADCEGCREMRDSHAVIGDWDTEPEELAALALEYRDRHQAPAVRALVLREMRPYLPTSAKLAEHEVATIYCADCGALVPSAGWASRGTDGYDYCPDHLPDHLPDDDD